MSGTPNWAFTAPSRNCTALCTIDCGCTSTSICRASTPNSHLASITSNPLFIIVALSIVILAPISHVGWRNASALVTVASRSVVMLRNGPPEAVSSIFSISLSPSPAMLWNMAECSLSTGSIGVRYRVASSLISSPATTSVSLLARQMVFRALMACIVGDSPAKPTIAVSTMSIGPDSTISSIASGPAYTFMSGSSASSVLSLSYSISLAMTTAAGLNRRACSASSSTLLLAVRQYTSYRSECSSITCSA